MAYQTPAAVQNQNLHIYSGKDAAGAKINVRKTEQKGRKDRKALRDISVKQPSSAMASKPTSLKDKSSSLKDQSSTLKDKSAVCSNENPRIIPNSDGLTDKETMDINEWAKQGVRYGLTEEAMKQCYEWAKKGIEQMHFSGNDEIALKKELSEKCVDNEVEEVLSGLGAWTQMCYGLDYLQMPTKGVGNNYEDGKAEYDSEVLLSSPTSLSTSGRGDIVDRFAMEDDLWSLPDDMIDDLKLKEEYEIDV